MEKVRRVVNEIAYAHTLSHLTPFHRSLLPFLSIASTLYKLALSLRRSLYRHRFFQVQRYIFFGYRFRIWVHAWNFSS